MSIYSVGVSALRNAQLGITTAGHNITNANTPGYHRQGIIQSTNVPLYSGAGFVGQGAHVDTIRRALNKTLETQLLQVQARGAELDSYLTQLTPLDNAIGSADSGVSAGFDNFFQALSGVSASPASVPARQALISNAQALVTQFQSLGQRFNEVRNGLDTQIQESVLLINSYASQIADLNEQIAFQSGSGEQGQLPNDLLDKREQLISELNKEVGTTTLIQDDGSASVFFGSGQPIVMGGRAFTLSAAAGQDDPQHLDVTYQIGSSNVLIGSNNIDGGRLGGLLEFRDDILDEAQNAVGRVALGLAQTFNDQHHLGIDLAGNLGGDFFSMPAMTIQPRSTNTGVAVLSASLANVQHITTSDYRLVKDTVGADYTLTRLSDNQTTAITAAQLAAGFTKDGMTLTVAGALAGDAYLIRPTRDVAENIAVSANINTTTIAAGAPIRTSATLGNLGTGQISLGAVNSPNNKVTITFTGAGTYTATDNTTGAPLFNSATGTTTFNYVSGSNININGWTAQISGVAVSGDTFVVENAVTSKIQSGSAASTTAIGNALVDVTPLNTNLRESVTITFTNATTFTVSGTGVPALPATYTYNSTTGTAVTFNGWSAKITGSPQANDTFTIGSNTNSNADSRNTLLLSQLQSADTLGAGTVSYEGSFSQMVALVGNKASEIQIVSEAQNVLIEQTQAQQQSVSGVNLDEEAADLLRFQQAYQAAGRMLEISSSLFDTLLSIGR